MQLIVLGLNHNTAPVSVRESLSVSSDALDSMYEKLLSDERIFEALILSTCNRVEYYVVTDETFSNQDMVNLVASATGVSASLLNKHSYIWSGTEAVSHIAEVASGTDSLVLGEPQIFGQVKEAFRDSKRNLALKSYLNRLEQFVHRTAKRVRTNTGIAENAVTVSYAAVDLAKKIFGSLEGRVAMVIGAGEMCELAAEHLAGAGIGEIYVTNRTYARAEALARRFYGKAIPFEDFPDHLVNIDIIISSTGSPTTVVNKQMIEKAMQTRKRASMFFIDIAVPRDVDCEVGRIQNVYVYDIDDLKLVVEANRKERENEALKARELIAGAVSRFERSIEALSVSPLIREVRSGAFLNANKELERFCRKNKVLEQKDMERLEYLLEAALNKVLHTPTVNLKRFADDKRKYTLAEAMELLFNPKKK